MKRLVPFLALAACACSVACSPAGDGAVPEDVIRHNIVGTARLGQTKWSEAEVAFRLALEQRPRDALLLTNAAIACNQQEEIDEARALLERAVEADPDYASAHFNLGLIASRQGEFEQAEAHFRRVVELDPDDLFGHYFLGTSLARIEREAEAIDELRVALERDPTHVSTLYALGRQLLQRGEQETGMELITRSQEIRVRSGLDEAVGAEYGEQGLLSRATDYPGGALPAPEPIPVSFDPTARVRLETRVPGLPFTLTPVEDGTAMLVAQRATVLQLIPPGRSEPVAVLAVEGAEIVALAAGDVDDDGRVDLALLQATRAEGGTRLRPAWLRRAEDGSHGPGDPFGGQTDALLSGGLAGVDLAFVDRDHDGDLDLFWCWSAAEGSASGCKLATNDGEGRFETRGSGEHGFELEVGPGVVAVAFSDIDNDRDIDLLVAGTGGLWLFSNQRDGSYNDVSEAVGLGGSVDGARSVSVADLDKDGWMDLLVGGSGGPRLLLNRRGHFGSPSPLTAEAGGSGPAVVFDFDNDGFLDVVGATTEGPRAYHNRGSDWKPRDELLPAEDSPLDTAPLTDVDADGDGDPDLVTIDGTGTVTLWTNEGGNANRWIVLDTQGVGDNHFGIGTKVEVLAGALRQKFEVTRPIPLRAGLGSRDSVQTARYVWPSGVLQDEIELSSGSVKITQLDRKGTSCPLLYAWRGESWSFVTDFLGGAAIGYQLSPGVFSVPDTDEYVRIEGGLDVDDEGRVRLRLNNQLEEVIWFDGVELVAVDHPAGTEVYPNERLMPGPPFPDFGLFASKDVRPIAAAHVVDDETDVTDLLRDRDDRFVSGFRLLRPKGYAEMHTLELDLGPVPDARLVLLLDGWIDYADSSANVAAAQAGLSLLPPRLHVADGRGGWIDVSDERMGFPAGLPKTMAVELTGLFPAVDRRVRITTNMRIYWDRARVMVGGEATPLAISRLEPIAARLGFGGFPRTIRPGGGPALAYDPGQVDPDPMWKAHVGAYTGFGDVLDLIRTVDDRFVTTRNGDQVELAFRAPAPPASGTTRTWLLYADGFGKDMDTHSAAGETVGPIPFHGMPNYPYAAEVIPPAVQRPGASAPRHVAHSPFGWPGAPPFGRHATP